MIQGRNTPVAPSASRPIQGPRGYPGVGVIPDMARDSLGYLVQTSIRYNGVVRLPMGPRSMYVISNPDAVKHILQDNYRNYVKGYDAIEALLGRGLVTSDGSDWLRQRRLMQPAFHRQKVVSLLGAMTEVAAAMLERWRVAARNNQPVDVAAETMRLTQRIIVATMFGADIGDQGEPVIHAFATTLDHVAQTLLNPVVPPLWVPTPMNRAYHQAVSLLDSVVYRIIDERRRSGRSANDLLSMLIDAEDAETGERMTDRQVRDEVMTIFLAGHETTATFLAWACHTLARHPEVERKMCAELAAVLGGRTPTATDLPKLTYTRMVIDEVLRLYPVAWMFGRRALADDEIAGYQLPAGTKITISPYITHRFPDLWPDPETFDPERFSPERPAPSARFAYYPFAGGPRVCIGNTFALMESQLILAMIYQTFRPRLMPGRPVRPKPGATLHPHPGVWMTLHDA